MKNLERKITILLSLIVRFIFISLFVKREEEVTYFVRENKYTKKVHLMNFWNPITYPSVILYAIIYSALTVLKLFFILAFKVSKETFSFGASENRLYRQLKKTVEKGK